jgi:hypothetical protein
VTPRTVLLLAVSVLAAMTAGGCGSRLREASEQRQCRANMNQLATEEAQFFQANGRWAELHELELRAHRTDPLLCPSCSGLYRVTLAGSSYRIDCPCDRHGFVQDGNQSWATEERPVTRRST